MAVREKLDVCVVSFGGSCSNALREILEMNGLKCRTCIWDTILCHCPEYIKLDMPVIYVYDNPIKAFLSQKKRGVGVYDSNQRKLSNNKDIAISDENLLKHMLRQFKSWTSNYDPNVLIVHASDLFQPVISQTINTFLNKNVTGLPLTYKRPNTILGETEITPEEDSLFECFKTDIDAVNAMSTRLLSRYNGIWEEKDKLNYYQHQLQGVGQIHDDEFFDIIKQFASNPNFRTYLEIGTWNGLGSTKAFAEGFSERPQDYQFFSLECNRDKCIEAQQMYKGTPNMQILNEVIWNSPPSNLYTLFPRLRSDPQLREWHRVDMENMKKCKLFLERRDLPRTFDVVLLDGGEFTTYHEFQILRQRCSFLLLDDINAEKCKKIVIELRKDPTWKILRIGHVRNGFLIAQRRR